MNRSGAGPSASPSPAPHDGPSVRTSGRPDVLGGSTDTHACQRPGSGARRADEGVALTHVEEGRRRSRAWAPARGRWDFRGGQQGLWRLTATAVAAWTAVLVSSFGCSDAEPPQIIGGQDTGQKDVADDKDTGAFTNDGLVTFPDIPDTSAQSDVEIVPGGPGWECLNNDDCDSEWCVITSQGKQCSEKCIDSCLLEGWGCKPVETLGGDQAQICLPLYPNLCDPCASHADCNLNPGDSSSFCLPREDGLGSFCGADCSTGIACPDGYACEDIQVSGVGVRKQCQPTAGACGCSARAIALELATPCSSTNEYGTCLGERTCEPVGLSPCSADVPAEETCDAGDDDCDGETDEDGATGCVPYFKDLDEDDYGSTASERCLCGPNGTFTAVESGDCNDSVALVNPSSTEQCDGVDNDCDGETDEAGALGCTKRYADVDQDTWGDLETEVCLCADDGAHPALKSGDCDDTTDTVSPVAAEVCDGLDNDCDGFKDPVGATGCTLSFLDADTDTFGIITDSKCLCTPTAPYSATLSGDCDDKNGTVNPDAAETCGGIDDNCDGITDPPNAVGCQPYYRDIDEDKVGLADDSQCLCAPSAPYSALAKGDCNDADPFTSPIANEACNDKDDDCDGSTDEFGAAGCKDHYKDEDGDDYGLSADARCLCDADDVYSTLVGGDCDDEDEARSPAASEQCGNGKDDDCDGQTDEEGGAACVTYYRDSDGDLYGTELDSRCLCGPGGAFTTKVAGDCNDNEKPVYPGAAELCNTADDDCDGQTDEEGASSCVTYFLDDDKDLYGVTGSTKCLCAATAPYTALIGGDCKDSSDEIRPNRQELCNGIDDDCNDVIDDENAVGCEVRYLDVDKDGFGVPGSQKCVCPGHPTLTATKGGDCNDNDLLVYPGTPCGAPSCSGATLTSPPMCEGSGTCTPGGAAPCPGGTVCENTTACKTGCVSNADCIAGNTCIGGTCTGKKPDGTGCVDGSQCQSGYCDSGFCCAGGKCCGGVASQCDDGNPCTDNACTNFQCAASNNTAECGAAFCDGSSYTAPRTCDGGLCKAGGVITACTTSDPCLVAECSLTSGTGCRTKPAAPGTTCAAATCSGSTATNAKLCDGSGGCSLAGTTSTCPGGFMCNAAAGACKTSCTVGSDCRGGFYCDGGLCLPLKGDGSTCGEAAECISGYCESNVCCASGQCCRNAGDCNDENLCTTDACTGSYQCQNTANNLQCAIGSCLADGNYQEAKFCQDGACTTGGGTVSCESNDPCKIDTCNAATGGCGQKATPIGTTCAPASCTGASKTTAKVCDGLGSCALGGSIQPCPGGYTCGPDGESCRTGCTSSTECQAAYFCSGGICLPKKVDGGTCTTAADCVSGNCVNGTCCSSGKTCCQDDGDCDDGNACTLNTCNGESWCTVSFAPVSTQCEAGSCNGLTRTLPKNCNGSGSCTGGGTTENCDLGGACRSYGCTPSACTTTLSQNGTVCGASTCSNYTFTPTRTCQAGLCKSETATVCVGGYACASGTGSCSAGCVTDAGCQPGYFCAATGACQPKRDDGEACSKDSQCSSAHCDGGICCSTGRCCLKNSDCGDGNTCTDDACNTTTFTCGNPNNTNECLQGFCFGLEHYAGRTCSAGACAVGGAYTNCAPQTPNSCFVYGCDPDLGCTESPAASGVVCGAPSCIGNKLTSSSTCNGAGTCTSPTAITCAGGFSCNSAGTACRTGCTTDSECSSGFFCASPNCVPKKIPGGPCTTNAECSTGYCNSGFCCTSGSCCGSDLNCNDGEGCTLDYCDPTYKCATTKLTSQCATPVCNGLVFSNTKFCELGTGKCTGGGALTNCDGGNPCYSYACDPAIIGNPCVASPRTGAPCGAGQSCSANKLTTQSTCNGSGSCLVGNVIDCPNGLTCADATACRSLCTQDTHCRAGYFCDTGTSKCAVKVDDGGVCLAGTQCASGYCNSGYCCTNTGSNPTCCPNAAFCDDGSFCKVW
ncbi:MAG: putative metal-binding motif-containing protein, partial [Myxococcales bacterium]|nr:putative metal-binding motif-containing protein [Myxococcales bacterium]